MGKDMINASLVIYHNSKEDVNKLLDCVLSCPIDNLFIIDNSRNDFYRTLECRSEKIRYIHNENIGYGASHNIAIRESIDMGAKYHVVLNPDVYFENGTIETIAKYIDNYDDIGWVMPKVVYPDNSLQYLCKPLPTPMDLLLRRFFPKKWFAKSKERFELRAFDYNHELNVPFLSGCFIFLRTSALKDIGLFDERFFMYGEDIDFSRRMHQKYRTMYFPGATIIHAHKAESKTSRKMLLVHIKSIITYFNKWGWFFDNERTRVNKNLSNALNKICSNM